VPTFTPYYTPSGWQAMADPSFATPTPCVFNCDPISDTEEIPYFIFSPVIARAFNSYDALLWTHQLYVNDVLTNTTLYTVTVAPGDTVQLRDTLVSSAYGNTYVMRSEASASLTLTETVKNSGSVTSSGNVFTWTVTGGGGTADAYYTVNAGGWATDAITRVLRVYASGVATPTQVLTRVQSVYH